MADFVPNANAIITPPKQFVPNQSAKITPPREVGWGEASVRLPASSLTRGLSYLAGAPRALSDLAETGSNYLMEKAGVPENVREGVLSVKSPLSFLPKAETMIKGASDLTGGFTDYQATSPEGKALGKAIEFAPAAIATGLTGGLAAVPQALMYGAAIPAAAGYAAKPAGDAIGRVMEAENPEKVGDYAQMGAEVLSSFVAPQFGPALSRVPKSPQISDVAKDIDRLEKFGVSVTPGSIRANPDQAKVANLLEMQNPKLGATIRAQGEQFSKGILRDAGVTDDLAKTYGFKVISPMNADIVVGKHLDTVGFKIGSVYDNLISSGQPRPLMLENKGLGAAADVPPVTGVAPQSKPLLLEDKRSFREKMRSGTTDDSELNPFQRFFLENTDEVPPSANPAVGGPEAPRTLGDAVDQAAPQAMPDQPALPPNNTLNVTEIEDMASKIPNLAKYDGSLSPGQWIHGVRTEANQIMAGAHPTMGTSYKPQAKALIDYIDSKVFGAVGDVEFGRLQALNGEYSKLKTLQDALANSAAQGHPGIITPRSVISAGGTRHTKDINEISDLADKYLLNRGMIPNEENKKMIMRRIINTIVAAGGAGVQGAMFGFGMNPVNAVKMGLAAAAAGAGSAALQATASAAKGSKAAQSLARSRALYQTANPYQSAVAPIVTNTGELRAERKSGGRVSSHDMAADQLVRAAERAKKGLSAQTEPLLNQSDETVVKALEVANRSI